MNAKSDRSEAFTRGSVECTGRTRACLVGMVVALFCSSGALAQISKPTDKDLETAPPQFKAQITGNPAYSNYKRPSTPPNVVPTTGPRDFTGIYTSGPPAAPPPDAVGGSAAVAPPPPPPAAPVPNPGALGEFAPEKLCRPSFEAGLQGGYPTHVMMSPGRVTIIPEENHRIRRIYMDAEHPKSPVAAYTGDSVGHWEGDTLVVDTIAIRGMEDQHVVERIRKIENGRSLEAVITTENTKTGAKTTRTNIAHWRPDLSYVEDICEDFGEAYGQGYLGK